MSKTFKLIIVVIFTTYHFSFIFSKYYREPKIIYRQRKSGTWPRSFKTNWPRKAFEIRDRKAFGASDFYSKSLLKEIESRMQAPMPSVIQQWQAAVKSEPWKKDKIPETVQKSRQKDVDMVRPEEQPRNTLEEATKQIKNSHKEIQQLKEEKRKKNQNKIDRHKKEESLSMETLKTRVHNMPKKESEQDPYPKASQIAEVEKNPLRGGHHRNNNKNSKSKHTQQCAKKCFSPKCVVECIGRKGSAACNANKCKATTHGPDSAAVCKGKQCVGHCSKEECIAACEGDGCGVQCEGNICHAVADGAKVTSKCKGDYCVAYGKGLATKSTCDGNHCQTWCAGDNCIAECKGVHCEAMCAGYHCKAQCQGRNCTKSHYAGYPPKPGKPWVVESDSNSKEKPISDEFDVRKPHGTKPNKYEYSANVDNDGYYGNKDHVKHTINSIDSTFVPNDNKDYNSGNVPIESVPNGITDPERNVTIGYTIDITVGKELTDYLKEKIHQMDDLTLLRYLPSLL